MRAASAIVIRNVALYRQDVKKLSAGGFIRDSRRLGGRRKTRTTWKKFELEGEKQDLLYSLNLIEGSHREFLDAKERLKIAILINKNIWIGRVLNDLVSREELAAPDKICTYAIILGGDYELQVRGEELAKFEDGPL